MDKPYNTKDRDIAEITAKCANAAVPQTLLERLMQNQEYLIRELESSRKKIALARQYPELINELSTLFNIY